MYPHEHLAARDRSEAHQSNMGDSQNMGTRVDFNVTGYSEDDRDDISMQQSMGTGEMGAALAGVQVGLN